MTTNYKIKVPFVDLTREAKNYLPQILLNTDRVLKSGQYINGPFVKEFESLVSEYLGVKYTISVGNGSDALMLILKSLNLSLEDEVICPANSFIASAWSIIAAGAKPVFCDVRDDFLLDPIDFQRKITSKTKVVMPVHLTGRVFEVGLISQICIDNGIKIVEDAAQSFGAFDSNNIKTGALGDAAAFSLHPLKNLSIYGDGGLITTNDKKLAEDCLLFRNHGLINRDEASVWGYNSRLDELQASYALIKLKNIEDLTSKYIGIANFYNNRITNQVIKPKIRTTLRDVYHNYVVVVPPHIRDDLIEDLSSSGIGTKIHYPTPLHLQMCAKDLNYKPGDIPNVERLAQSMISLPIFPFLEEYELEHVVNNFNNLITKYL